MGILDYILLAAVGAWAIFAAAVLIRRRLSGKTCCGSACSSSCRGCAHSCGKH